MTGFGSLPQLLDDYMPAAQAEEPRWEDVLFRAELLERAAPNGTVAHGPTPRNRPARRPRLIALAAVVAVVLLVPMIAFAIGHRWWFEQPGAVAPHGVSPLGGRVSVFASGAFGGHRWTTVGYLSKDPSPVWTALPPKGRLVCVSVILGNLTNNPTGFICGAPAGMIGVRSGRTGPPRQWLVHGYPLVWPLTAGFVAKNVARVEVVVANHDKRRTIDVPLLSVPSVGSGIRFFALAYGTTLSSRIDSISAYSSSGKLLQRNGQHPYIAPINTKGTR